MKARRVVLESSPVLLVVFVVSSAFAVPLTPVGVGVSNVAGGTNRLTVSWSPNTEGDLKDYGVYRATGTGALGTKVLVTRIVQPGTTHQDVGLTNGTTYYLQLTARDTTLNESGGSGEASGYPIVDVTPPATVSGLSVSAGTGLVNLTWTANTEGDLKDYRIRQSTVSGISAATPVLATIIAPGTTHRDSGLAGNTTYFFRLSARDTSLNESGLSVEVSTRPGAAGDTTPPATPTGLTVTQPAQDRTLVMSWSANTEPDFSQYRLYKGTFSGLQGSKTTIITVTVTGYTEGGLLDGTTYYYQLTAVDGSANASGPTGEVSGVTRGGVDTTPPAAISDLTALAGTNDGQVRLAWTAPGDDGMTGTATTYELRRATFQITTPAEYSAAVVVATASWVGSATPAPAGTASTTTIVGLNPGVTYYFSMKASDEVPNWSSLAAPANNWAPAQNGPPNAPATPNGTSPGGGIINLYWTANTEADIAKYRIFRATFSGAIGTKPVVTTVAAPGTTYQDAGLTQSINYFYQLMAEDTVQSQSGGSGERSIFAGDLVAPSSPTALGVANPGLGGRLNLSWAANTESDLKDYRTWRSTFSSAVSAKSSTTALAAPGTTHQDAGLVNGTSYYYQLTARDMSGNESAGSPEVFAYPTGGGDTIPPAAVTDLTATTQAQVMLSWTASSDNAGVTGYLIRYSTLAAIVTEGDWSAASIVGGGIPAPLSVGTTQTAVITGLKPRTTHWFAIKSQDAAGNVSALDTSSPEPNALAGSFVLAQEPAGVPGLGDGAVAWGDYDNDGDLDLVVNGRDGGTTNRFRVYRNDGGIFNLAQEPAGSTGPGFVGSVVWGDYDNDGDLDLVVTGDDGAGYRFRVYRNDGGTFNLVQEPAGSTGPGGYGAAAWGDYDNDGDLDLAVNGYDGAGYRFRVYRNDGGTFNLAQEPAGATGPGAGVAWGDYDNDGDLDLAVNGYDGVGYRFRVYKNDGGIFNLVQEPAGGTGPGTGAVAWGDYDNDGDLDLVVKGWDGVGYRFRVYRNDGGTLNLAQEPAGAAGLGQYGAAAWGDYDNDGDLDLAVTGLDGAGYQFRVYRNDGGTFNLAQEPAGVTGPGGYGAVAWGDYDNDGDLDLAVNGDNGAGYRFRVYKSLEADFGNVNTAPVAPTGLTSSISGSTITFTWAFGTDAQSPAYGLYYQVRVSTIAGGGNKWVVSDKQGSPLLGNYMRALTTSPAQGRAILKSLTVGATYYWAVRTIDTGLRASVWSAEVSTGIALLSDTAPPAVPTGLGAANAGVSVVLNLSWSANTEGDMKDYGVYRATTSGALGTKALRTRIATPGTTHQDAGVVNGTTYYYQVTARDTSLNESGGSSEVNRYPKDTQAPGAPTSLGVSNTAGGAWVGNRLSLSWVANTESDLGAYRVYRASYTGWGSTTAASVVNIAEVLAPGTTHQDVGLTNGTTYYYRLTARDTALNEWGYNESALSTEVFGVPAISSDTTPPAAPTGLEVSSATGGTNRLALSWSPNTEGDLKDYGIYRATTSGGLGAKVLLSRIVSPGTTHQDGGLINGNTYYFQLTARDTSLNESGGSVEVSGVPQDTQPPLAPGGLVVTDVPADQGGALRLSWVANSESDLRQYNVYGTTAWPPSGIVYGAGILAPVTTYTYVSLQNGTTYYFRLTAADSSANESGYASQASGIPYDNLAPSVPTGFGVATSGTVGLNLSWATNTEGDLKDYGVYRATTAGGVDAAPTRITTPGTTHQAAGLTGGATYYFRLMARDVNLNESGISAEVSGIPTDLVPPIAPGAGAALNTGDWTRRGRLNLFWEANTETDLKDYGVYRGTWSGTLAAKTRVAWVVKPGTTHQDAGLTNGSTYYYQFTARDVSGNESSGSAQVTRLLQDTTGMTVPTGFVVSSTAGGAAIGGRLALWWIANTEEGLKDYGIYRATFSGIVGQKISVLWIAAPGTTHQDGGLTNGTTYYYQLTARDTGLSSESWGSAEGSGIAGTTDVTPPAMPMGLGVADVPGDQGGALRLSWTANTESDMKDYGVYRATYSGAPVAPPTNITRIAAPGTTHQDAGLANGTTYYYRLTARDVSLNESGGSADASGMPLDNLAPAAPATIFVSSTTGGADVGNRISVWWTAVADADIKDYLIRRATSGATAGAPIVATIAQPGTTHQDAGLVNGTTYYYQVDARDTSGNASSSGSAGINYGAPQDALPPGAPSGLGVGDPGTTALNLSWLANTESDLKDYGIYRATWTGASPIPTRLVTRVATPGTTHQETGLTSGAAYYYRLTARDTSGNESGGSTEVFGVPGGPAAPAGLGVANTGVSVVLNLSWSANTEGDMKDYGVYRATTSGALGTKALRTRIATPGTTHQEAGVVNGTTYYFQVTARDAALNESGGSSEVSGVPAGTSTPITNVNVTWASSDKSSTLTWDPVGGATGYTVYRRFGVWKDTAAFFVNATTAASVASSSTSYKDTIGPGTWTYGVRADGAISSMTAENVRNRFIRTVGAVDGMGTQVGQGGTYAFSYRLEDAATVDIIVLSSSTLPGRDANGFATYNATDVVRVVIASATRSAEGSAGNTVNTDTWDLKDSGGTQVSSGTYPVLIQAHIPSGNIYYPPADRDVAELTVAVQVPRAATGLSAVSGSGMATLSWTANTEADLKDYRIRRTTFVGVGIADPVVAVVAAPGTTYQDAGLTNATTYYYRLAVRNTSGNESGLSVEVSTRPFNTADTTPPAAPTGLGVANPGTGGRLNVSWAANTEGDFKDYGVYRTTWAGASPTPTPTRIATPGTTHQDTGLTNGTTYYYRLTARDASLNESGGSVEASGIPLGGDGTPPIARMTVPALNSTVGTPPAVISGTASDDQSGVAQVKVLLRRNADSYVWGGSSWTLTVVWFVATGTANWSYNVGSVTWSTGSYAVSEQATDGAGNVSGANTDGFTYGASSGADTTPPAAPTGFGAANPGTGGRLNVSWTANTESDMKDYGVYRATTAGGVDAAPTRITAPGTTHQAAGLANGTTYYFRLTARDASLNESSGSVEVSSIPSDNSVPLVTVSGATIVGSDPVVVQPSLQPVVIQAQTDTKTQVVIPASMFTEAVRVGIRSRESLPPATVAVVDAAGAKVGGRVLGAKTREFTVTKLDGSAIVGFGGLVDAYLPYDDADRDGYVDGTTIRVKDLKAYRLDETSQEWKPVSDGGVNEVDETRQVVHVQLKHFSLYAVGLAASAGRGAPEDRVTVGPNPARAGEAPSVWFYADWPRWSARARWFGPDGSLVAEITDAESSAAGSIEREAGLKKAPAVANVHRAMWAGRNASGARVASGVYVVETEITNPDTGEVRRVLKKILIVK